MVRHLTPESADRAGSLDEMVSAAMSDGAPKPCWVAVDDRADELARSLASESGSERARGVVATSNDRTLAVAHQLGVGGAVAVPPSSVGVSEALRAAASAPVPLALSPCLLSLLDGVEDVRVATVADRLFWQAQLGTEVLVRLLAELATALGVPQMLVAWPALVVAGVKTTRIRDAWQPLASGPGRPVHDLVVAETNTSGGDVLAGVYRALVDRDGRDQKLEVAVEPVHELPGGGLVGSWSLRSGGTTSEGWMASPAEVLGLCCRWRLVGPDGMQFAQDVLDAGALTRLNDVVAARVPGSVGGALRRGSPAGLLVQRLAEAAHRRGLPLWIPNVDQEGLKLALRFPGTLWIDGPAVPR